MKGLLKVLGATVLVFLILVVLTGTVTFIKKVWFGGKSTGAHIAVLDISGMLTQSRPKIKELEALLENSGTKAIVVRVNSPGGLVAPSQELYNAIRRADEKVPVVISMGPLAASGGYYLSLGARKIVANPGTLTASIGVIIELVNTKKLFEWAKVERFAITSGKFKATGSPFKPMTAEERELLTKMVLDIYAQFKATVKERRKLTDAELVETTDGRVMTGTQALQAKLVDQIGDLHDAVEAARTLAKLPADAAVDYHEAQSGMVMKLLFGDDSESADNVLRGLTEWRSEAGLVPGWRVMFLSVVR